jgi:hypothetical protein
VPAGVDSIAARGRLEFAVWVKMSTTDIADDQSRGPRKLRVFAAPSHVNVARDLRLCICRLMPTCRAPVVWVAALCEDVLPDLG